MSLKRRKILKQMIDRGYGTQSVPADSGGTLTGDKVGIHTFMDAYFNVRDFGASGNGVTDDSNAVQAAINAIDPSVYGTVYVPAGTYVINDISFTSRKVNFIGAGREATILYTPTTGHDGLHPTSGCRIAHMTIRGPNAASSGFIGIDAGSSDYVTLEDLIVEKWGGHGINSGAASNYWTIDNVISRNNLEEGMLITGQSNYWRVNHFIAHGNRFNGIDVSGLGHKFSNLILYSNGGDTTHASTTDQDGMVIVADPGTPLTDGIEVTNALVYSNNTHGIRVQPSVNCTIQRIRLSDIVAYSNGTGDGSGVAAQQFGDGVIITTHAAVATIQDATVTGHFESNYRYGINIQAGVGNIKRTRLINCSTLNHTGWSLGAAGVILQDATATDTQIIGLTSLSNTSNYTDTGATRTVIAGKISDTTGNFTVLPRLTIGNGATTGPLGMPNDQYAWWKDSGGTDRIVIGVSASNETVLRGTGGTKSFILQTLAATTVLNMDETTSSLSMERRFNWRPNPTFSDGDLTPSVSAGNIFSTANTAPTSITTFDDGIAGQEIMIIFTDANTTLVNGATMRLAGAANFTSTGNDTLTLILSGTTWYEKCRSVN